MDVQRRESSDEKMVVPEVRQVRSARLAKIVCVRAARGRSAVPPRGWAHHTTPHQIWDKVVDRSTAGPCELPEPMTMGACYKSVAIRDRWGPKPRQLLFVPASGPWSRKCCVHVLNSPAADEGTNIEARTQDRLILRETRRYPGTMSPRHRARKRGLSQTRQKATLTSSQHTAHVIPGQIQSIARRTSIFLPC